MTIACSTVRSLPAILPFLRAATRLPLRTFRIVTALVATFLALISLPSVANAGDGASDAPATDRTLSPYFFVDGGDPSVDSLPLRGTRVDVAVTGAIADVTVTQSYENRGKRALNLRYVFPASTRAAVHGMKMTIGDREVVATIREREAAQREYEAAKREGKTASLLEENRPNVFTMNVANVMPGDRIDVTLNYTELLIPTDGTYEFVYPTVVGPRYSSGTPRTSAAKAPEQAAAQQTAVRDAGAPDTWIVTPYLHAGQLSPATFALTGTLSAAVPVASLDVPSHRVTTRGVGQTLAHFDLDASESQGNNRDFILRYGLAGSAIQAGVSLYEKAGEKYFMAVLEPPQRVAQAAIVPREYVFIVDVSGSMHGFPLDTAKKLLVDLVGGLRATDRFNVLFFSGGATLMSERSVAATESNISAAVALLESAEAGGGTELLPALERALALPTEESFSRSFVVVTDGYIAEDKATFQYVRQHLGDANVFSFGIGSGVNRYLVEGIAKAGLGEPFVVTDPDAAPATAARFRSYVTAPVLTRVKVGFDGFQAFDVEPKAIPDVFATRPVVVHGKWRGAATGKLVLTGRTSTGTYRTELDVSKATPKGENRALPYLWARTRISNLVDFSFGNVTPEEQATITKLGLRYSLLTPYTSFIAVSQQVRNDGAPAQDVTQPLPLPAGVEDSAIGSQMMGADEPGLFSLLLACGSLFLGCALFVSCRRGFGSRSGMTRVAA